MNPHLVIVKIQAQCPALFWEEWCTTKLYFVFKYSEIYTKNVSRKLLSSVKIVIFLVDIGYCYVFTPTKLK